MKYQEGVLGENKQMKSNPRKGLITCSTLLSAAFFFGVSFPASAETLALHCTAGDYRANIWVDFNGNTVKVEALDGFALGRRDVQIFRKPDVELTESTIKAYETSCGGLEGAAGSPCAFYNSTTFFIDRMDGSFSLTYNTYGCTGPICTRGPRTSRGNCTVNPKKLF